jgi:hypothetical protein
LSLLNFSKGVNVVKLTFEPKFNYVIQQVSSEFSQFNVEPIMDLASILEEELSLFYKWSLNQIETTKDLMVNFFTDLDDLDREYLKELYTDCLKWYLEEGNVLFYNFKRNLPQFIQGKQFRDLKDSMEGLKRRWSDLQGDIESIDEFEDVYNWLLDLPYLLEKRLQAFGLISNLSNEGYHVPIIQQDIKIVATSPVETCLSYIFYRGCAS